ncbi:MAG: response regulator [Candidatus Omnitrophica bacterium]|nr:response regulator [Candidatus Omnitrophota bacterium]MCM8831481.1 response regulator [Candidatus Omnitrophota bacterium]
MAKKILIVDDEQEVLDIVSGTLKKSGYEVICTKTGEEAIEFVKTQNPNIILLDICLPEPGIDGVETLKRIREFNKEVKVIVTSGLEKGIRRFDEIKNLEIVDFLSKPFSLSKLKELIKSL